jgi:hypothetical protein
MRPLIIGSQRPFTAAGNGKHFSGTVSNRRPGQFQVVFNSF